MDEDLLALGASGHPKAELRYMALSALTGAIAGVLGAAFHLAINRLIEWPTYLAQHLTGWSLVGAAAIITMLATVLAAFLVRRFAPEASGSGVQEVEGAMINLRQVRWRRVIPVKFFAGIIALSSGLVLGREGPTIHMGAAAGAAVSENFKTNELERRGLLACGAAAGLSCAFNAPLSAVLFVIEETHREFPYTFRTFLGVGVAAIASTIVTQSILGPGADLPLLADGISISLLPIFVLLGVVVGFVGVLLNASILRALTFSSRSQARVPYLYPAVIGLAVGALFILLPQSVTGGESVILELAAHNPGAGVLLALAAIRFVTMVGSYSSGVPGGIFAPILALAACIGFAFGEGARILLPVIGIAPLAFAIAAMGGLFTSSVRAPMVGVVLTLELTGSYALVLPLMVTCVASDLVAQWSGGRPIYSQLLERTLAQAGIKRRPEASSPTGLA